MQDGDSRRVSANRVVNRRLSERTGVAKAFRSHLTRSAFNPEDTAAAIIGGDEWESNPSSKPAKGSNGSFEGCEDHRAPCASDFKSQTWNYRCDALSVQLFG